MSTVTRVALLPVGGDGEGGMLVPRGPSVVSILFSAVIVRAVTKCLISIIVSQKGRKKKTLYMYLCTILLLWGLEMTERRRIEKLLIQKALPFYEFYRLCIIFG